MWMLNDSWFQSAEPETDAFFENRFASVCLFLGNVDKTNVGENDKVNKSMASFQNFQNACKIFEIKGGLRD